MARVLNIQASPRGKRSKSISITGAFIEAYIKKHPDDKIDIINLFQEDIPAFDGLAVQAKYTILHGKEHTSEELDAWKSVEVIIERFKSADKYVLAVPMWNFCIPYRLKQYIDILVQPGYTFSFSPEEGYKGQVTGKSLFVAYARGGEYPAESEAEAFDLQKKYIELIFGFMGFTDIRSVIIEPTLMGGPEVAQQKLADAIEVAKQIAVEF